jgi:hypothetical protein
MGPMKFRQQRFSGLAIIIGLFALSLAIFNWGLQYKMSLYQDSDSATQTPVKLWTGRTLICATSEVEVQHEEHLFAGAQSSFPMVLVFLSSVPETWLSRLAVPWKWQVLAALPAFAFRPPPALI